MRELYHDLLICQVFFMDRELWSEMLAYDYPKSTDQQWNALSSDAQNSINKHGAWPFQPTHQRVYGHSQPSVNTNSAHCQVNISSLTKWHFCWKKKWKDLIRKECVFFFSSRWFSFYLYTGVYFNVKIYNWVIKFQKLPYAEYIYSPGSVDLSRTCLINVHRRDNQMSDYINADYHCQCILFL